LTALPTQLNPGVSPTVRKRVRITGKAPAYSNRGRERLSHHVGGRQSVRLTLISAARLPMHISDKIDELNTGLIVISHRQPPDLILTQHLII
jgi:hypothetical protein